MNTTTNATTAWCAVRHLVKTIEQTRKGSPRSSLNDGLKVLANDLGRAPTNTEQDHYLHTYFLAIEIAIEGDKLNV